MEQVHLYELIRKYADGTASPEELQELNDWYRSIDTVEKVEWPSSDPMEKGRLQQRMLHRLESQIHDTPSGTTIVLPRLHRIPWLRVAASLILVAGAWILWQRLHQPETGYLSVNNPSGKIRRIVLPDNSQVWLNAASTLRYAKEFQRQRELYLEGEGYFDVTADKAHPFRVHAGGLTTTVLGTAFDIKSFPTEQQSQITVIRGKVQVDNEGRTLDRLTAARQLQWDSRDHRAQTVTVDTNQVQGWQQGRLQFRGQTMDEIAAALGRWYDIRFEFADPALRRCRYYLNFENTSPLRDILEAMHEMNDMNFAIDSNKHVVRLSGKGCQ